MTEDYRHLRSREVPITRSRIPGRATSTIMSSTPGPRITTPPPTEGVDITNTEARGTEDVPSTRNIEEGKPTPSRPRTAIDIRDIQENAAALYHENDELQSMIADLHNQVQDLSFRVPTPAIKIPKPFGAQLEPEHPVAAKPMYPPGPEPARSARSARSTRFDTPFDIHDHQAHSTHAYDTRSVDRCTWRPRWSQPELARECLLLLKRS
jgi:hypothetical protein